MAIASKYKSEFLSNMSHELRTPLNSLLLLAQSLAENKEGNLTDDQVQSAKIIHGSGSDLLNLINEILDLAKIESGRTELRTAPVRVPDIADEVRSVFLHLATDKGLDFDVRIAAETPAEIVTDATAQSGHQEFGFKRNQVYGDRRRDCNIWAPNGRP